MSDFDSENLASGILGVIDGARGLIIDALNQQGLGMTPTGTIGVLGAALGIDAAVREFQQSQKTPADIAKLTLNLATNIPGAGGLLASDFQYSYEYTRKLLDWADMEWEKNLGSNIYKWTHPTEEGNADSPQLTITQYSYGGTEYLGLTFIDSMGNNLGEYFPGGTVTVGPLTGKSGEILNQTIYTVDSPGFYEAVNTAISSSGYIDYIGSNINIVNINNSNGIYSDSFVGGVLAAANIPNTGDYLAPLSMMSAYFGAKDMILHTDYFWLMDPWMMQPSDVDSRVYSYVSNFYGLDFQSGNYTSWALSLYFDFHKALFPNLEIDQWVENFSNDFASNGSPIVVDLNGDGIQTTSIMTGAVNFDITGDGQKERTAWLSGEDAFLAYDANQNGRVDNVSELFGGLGRGEGYSKLSQWDINVDGVIDAADARFNQLSIWQDANQNGLTDSGELKSLAEAGITSLSLTYTVQDALNNGNLIGEVSTATLADKTVEMADAYFQFYPTNFADAANRNRINPDATHVSNTTNGYKTESVGFSKYSLASVEQPVLLQQIIAAVQDSQYQVGLQNRIQAYMTQIGLVATVDGLALDFTNLKSVLTQAVSSNYTDGIKDLVSFNLITKNILVDTSWDGWDFLSSILSKSSPTQQVIDFLLTKNIKVFNVGGFTGVSGSLSEIILGANSNDVLSGKDGDDQLYGLAGNDTLDGGSGIDILVGGDGNDSYIVDSTTDTITETATGGTDTVNSGVSFTLGANVEYLSLTGTSAINGTGNTLNNNLTGNSANNTLNGGAGNDTLNGGAGTDTLVGGDGNDTYIVDTTTDIITETATGGADTVQSSVTYTLGASSNLENLTLTGTSAINGTGNSLNNILTGNAAANMLDGGAGTDTLAGGGGNDTYIVDTTTDTIMETATGGADTVQSSVTYTLGVSLENLTLMGADAINGTGNELNNTLTGNSANNTLSGGAGNDILNGGAGTDILAGGDGNDTYIVDTPTDTITETATGGADTVQSSVTYTLGAYLENLTLTGAGIINGTGNELNNTLTGNSANNTLSGGAGNDKLNGGAGTDILAGGDGNDTYIVDTTTDTITETATGGADTVQSSVTYTLGAYLENLTLTGAGIINGTGNELNNTLTGNSANNTLSGGAGNDILNGGGGTDTLVGGDGNDLYIVDTTTDTITETATGGTDTIQSNVTYTLGAYLENLNLMGAGSINGTGNEQNNKLTGNSANNTLSGGAGNDILNGGAGTDTLIGGDGNDIYIVDTTTDTITETATGGTDTVQSSVSFTLGVSSNLENLTLIGTSAINGTGNALTNFLLGNSANNTLTDTAGGNDILQGLAGVDSFNDSLGNNLVDGGIGADIISTGSGRDIILGGKDNDTITTGTGYDVILFNKGDGADTINASVGTDNTLSLGGKFAYSDLSLSKSSNDLILKMGASDQITLKGWYDTGANNKSVLNLQVIAEAMQGFSLGGKDTLRNNKVETFNFANLVSAFDAAGSTDNWQLTDARLTAHLSTGSDTAAIGGDIAYQYGKAGSLTGIGLLAAQAVINNANVGQSAQTLNASSSWSAETIKLS